MSEKIEIVLVEGGSPASAPVASAAATTTAPVASSVAPTASAPRGSAAATAPAPKAGESALSVVRSTVAGVDQVASAAGLGGVTGPIAAIAAAVGPVGVFAAAVGSAALVTKAYVDVMDGQVDRLKGYSGPLAAATATSDVRSQLSDLRRAERVGPLLARYEDRRSRWEERAYDVWTEVLDALLRIVDQFGPKIDQSIGWTKIATEGLHAIRESLLGLVEWIIANVPFMKDIPENLKNILRGVAKVVDVAEDFKDKERDLTDPLRKILESSTDPIEEGDFGPVPGIPRRAPAVEGGAA